MENNNYIISLIADIESNMQRQVTDNIFKVSGSLPPDFDDFEDFFGKLEKKSDTTLQDYILELLEKRGPRRRSGKIDTVCFYQSCCISAATWSNFVNGKYSEETVRKIIAALKCNLEETQKVFKLAGYDFKDTLVDKILYSAILTKHHNTVDMYILLEYYSIQYPNAIKNYYKSHIHIK